MEIEVMLSNVDSQKMIFSIKVACLGAAIGFSFMVCYYLTRIPDHLQSAFLRSQYIPSRLDGLGALLIYGSTTLSGFIIAFIFVYWLYEKPERSGVSKSTWVLSGLGYAVGNAFIGGGIFMPLADQLLKSINVSASFGTSVLVIADHIFRIPLTMWLYGTQALYSSLISGFLFVIGTLVLYKLHEKESSKLFKLNYSTIFTIAFCLLIVSLTLLLPVSLLQYLG